MYYPILFSSLGFIVFFVWYLAADGLASRRAAGLAAIVAATLTCGLALVEPIRLGIDLKGGTVFLLQVQGNPTAKALEEAANVLHRRLDTTGVREITIVPEGSDRLKIEIPGLQKEDIAVAEQQLSRPAKLELRIVPDNAGQILAQAEQNGGHLPFELSQQYEILPEIVKDKLGKETTFPLVVYRKASLTGSHIVQAWRSVGQLGEPSVVFSFDNEGSQIFSEVTRDNIGRGLAIVLDNVVQSAPYIKTQINGSCSISGDNMSPLECEELASVLQNPLQNEIKILSENTVEASLGADSIKSGLKAGVLALILVAGFMLIYYRLSGLVAVIALAVNLLLLFGLLAQLQFTLTLPGIAGIVLTIGMAVDANVLIYERIRDELALGKPVRAAIDLGFERAFSAIFDSNITTLIPAMVLAYMGTGPLKGFAVTLVLGIIANLFAALVVSRNVFDWILAISDKPNLSMAQFLKSPRFNFLKYRWHGIAVSVVILLVGTGVVVTQGSALLGVDFRGGESTTLSYATKADIGDLRTALRNGGISDVVLLYTQGAQILQVQTPEKQGDKAVQILMQKFPQAAFQTQAHDAIGSQVGEEMKEKAIIALALGLVGILIYAAFRFEWSYAIAAAIGQLHDVLVALSLMALYMTIYGGELTLTLVGAFLTIAGYSINDKIVVFDRIREGVKLREKGSFFEAINRSLNLTLARTLLTGSTCLLATLALIIFGGPVIHDFSIAMFIGIVSGIYSSHFISPGLAWWLDQKHPSASQAEKIAARSDFARVS